MILGDRRESYRLDNRYVKDVSIHKRRDGMRNVSEGILPIVLHRIKGKEGRDIFSLISKETELLFLDGFLAWAISQS